MIYPTKDCKYDVSVWCQNFHEIEANLGKKIDKPSVAKVGQMLVVKSIDENGVPLEFEFVEQKNSVVLPEVTESDDGKFLMVVGGKWVAVESPFESVTQEEYDALVSEGTVDDTKYYFIKG